MKPDKPDGKFYDICPKCGGIKRTVAEMCASCRAGGVTLEERFWSKVDKSAGPDSCWLWTRSCATNNGYGRFWIGDKHMIASRFVYELVHGPIPAGMEVCHHCDTPACVNPKHLFLGTHLDNMRDASAKHRIKYAYGTDHPCSKLTNVQARHIRQEHAETGAPYHVLAKRYRVSETTIGRVLRNESWTHVL